MANIPNVLDIVIVQHYHYDMQYKMPIQFIICIENISTTNSTGSTVWIEWSLMQCVYFSIDIF